MRALAEDGPRMSCREVDAAELYRLRELLVDAEYLLPGDFQGLVSLRRLDVTVGRFPLSAGVFRGMPSLVDLEVTVVRRPGDGGADAMMLSPGVFEGLEGLEGLEHLGLKGRRHEVGFRLDRSVLRGLDGLVSLDVDSVLHVGSDALHGLPSLRGLRVTAVYVDPARRREESPMLPPEFLESASLLEEFRARHFR